MIDHFLSKRSNPAECRYLQDRLQFQLLGIAAMYAAIKSNEPVSMSSTQVEQMSGGVYTLNDIEEMEVIILKDLEWHLVAPTSLKMAQHILALVYPHIDLCRQMWSLIYDQVRFHTECSVRDYQMSTQTKPSTIALAAILKAVDELGFQVSENFYDVLQLVMEESFPSSQALVVAFNSLMDTVNVRLHEQEPSSNRSIPRSVSYEQFEV